MMNKSSKIFLFGDYSGVHSQLAKNLRALGYDAKVISDGDGYKQLPVDIKVPTENAFHCKLQKIKFIITESIGIRGLWNYIKFSRNFDFSDASVVQIINPVAIEQFGAFGNFLLIKRIKKTRAKLFLCALGDDYRWVSACLSKKYKYSALGRILEGDIKSAYYSLRYKYSPVYFFLSKYAESACDGIIAGLDDYFIAYEGLKKNITKINLPIDVNNFHEPKEINQKKIKIFHAWQAGKEMKKGNDILHSAMQYVLRERSDNVEYEIATGLSFAEFTAKFLDCDIFLDQIYSYDAGVSGALGLCAGKIVYSGFENAPATKEYSAGKSVKTYGVNATDDIDDLVNSLLFLLDNESVMKRISREAYRYALSTYDGETIAMAYLKFWKNE